MQQGAAALPCSLLSFQSVPLGEGERENEQSSMWRRMERRQAQGKPQLSGYPSVPGEGGPNATEYREQSSEAGGTLGKCTKAEHSRGLGARSEGQWKSLSKH